MFAPLGPARSGRDVVTTGIPADVGTFRNPPTYLAPGALAEIGADRIGALCKPVEPGW